MRDDIDYVLGFWFGDSQDDAEVAREKSALWWKKSEDTDKLIWAKFEHRVQQAVRGELRDWLGSSRGRLASIILIDQFCRNIYRNTPQAFAHDEQALAWTLSGLDEGVDNELRPIERIFFYLPLEHSENLGHQQRCVELCAQLLAAVPDTARDTFAGFLDFAERHKAVIERFGRFPHRNDILGRESTQEEIEFLRTPGSSF